jgi:hypothetical protein
MPYPNKTSQRQILAAREDRAFVPILPIVH